MMDKYFTAEQLESIKTAREQVGMEKLQQKQAEWAELIALVRDEMEKGYRPNGPKSTGAGEALDGPAQLDHRRRPRNRTRDKVPVGGAGR